MKRNKGKGLILLGLLLIAAALFLAAYNLYDGARAERSARQAASRLAALTPTEAPSTPAALPAEEAAAPEEIELPDYVLNPQMEMPVAEMDGIGYIGTLRIPALELELPVIGEWSYPNLKIAPCRYVGSAYLNTLVIAAHNYQSHFGTLKNLSEGDAVTFTDMDGNLFCYEVAALETLPPTAIAEMTASDYDLTLFTCTLGGANRVTARCDRVIPEDMP